MTCQKCKSLFPATYSYSVQKNNLLHVMSRWSRHGAKDGGSFTERAGSFSFNFPHIVMIAKYRSGIGAKLILDTCGEPRTRNGSLLTMLKECGAFESGRRASSDVVSANNMRAALRRRTANPTRAQAVERVRADREARRAWEATENYAMLYAIRRRADDEARRRYSIAAYYKHHEESKKRSAAYARRRYYETRFDPSYIIKRAARAACGRIVRKYKGKKSRRTLFYLGCTMEQALNHIEKQFKRGMSWANHGDWHIDHIIPLAAFDMTQESHVMQACNYRNLQPLWASDNLSKSDRFRDFQLELLCA